MKKRLIDLIVILAIITVFLINIINYNLETVSKYEVRQGKVKSVAVINGGIEAKEEEKITYGKDCIIIERFVDEGELIKVGDPVFRIDIGYDLISTNTEKEDVILLIEKEKVSLSISGTDKLNIERKRVNLLEEDYNRVKEKYESDKVLFNSGLITETELKNSKASSEIKGIELEEARNAYKANLELSDISERESLNRLSNLEKQLAYIELKESIHVSVDEEGIYYSEYNGVVIKTSKLNVITLKNTNIVEIAIVDNFTSYLFVGSVEVEQSDMLNEGDDLEFYDDSIRTPIMGRVTKKYTLVEDGKIRIEAEFLEERSAKLAYGREFFAWKVENPLYEIMIPKSAFITNEVITNGDTVELFKIETDDKGNKIARKISVVVEFVGDQNVGIDPSSVEGEIKTIILNPSYKIKDGVKIKW